MNDEKVKPHGWKTYTVGGLAIVGGVAGAYLDLVSNGEAVLLIAFGLGLFGLRDAFAKVIAERGAAVAQREGAKRQPPDKK